MASAAPSLAAPVSANDNAQQMEDRANRFLKDNPNPYTDRVIVIDADRFDAEVGMGRSRIGAVQRMLADKGLKNPSDTLIGGIEGRLAFPGVSPGGAPVLGTLPQQFAVAGQRLSVVVTMAEDGFAPGIPVAEGMDARTANALMNEHELAHALDPVTDFSVIEPYMPIINSKPMDELPWDKFPPVRMVPGLMGAWAMLYRSEARAEARAVGELVRQGASPMDIILQGSLRAWHTEKDPLHAVTPALWGVIEGITAAGGLQAFRNLSAAEAEKIYDDASDTGLSRPDAVLAFLACAYGTKQDEAEVREIARLNPDVAHGLGIYGMWNLRSSMSEPPHDASAGRAAGERLKDWDPLREMKRETLARDRVIMPATMLKTYTRMRDGLRAEAAAHPEDGVYLREKAVRLRTAFLSQALHVQVKKSKEGKIVVIPAPRKP